MTGPERPIHYENPFATPADQRTPIRRLRGRLAAPVTIWTAQGDDGPRGLTVSSLLVADGEPGFVVGLLNDTTDLWDALQASGRFVVHVAGASDAILADRFAGQRPSPGGLFEGVTVAASEWGPVIEQFATRAYCSLESADQTGYQQLIGGRVEKLELGDESPLLHYRGSYRCLESPPD